VVPVAWIYNAARDAIDVGGQELAQTKKFRDVARTGRAAIVIDDLAEYRPVASTRDRDPRAGRSDRALDAGEVALESMPLCVSLVTDRRSRRPAALPLLSRPPGPISTTRRPTSSPAVCAWPACRASATSASRMAARGATMGELPRAREAADIWLSFRAADGHSGAEAA